MPRDRDRDRGSLVDADGNEISVINPPPTPVDLVSDKKVFSTWGTWFASIFRHIDLLSWLIAQFRAPNMTTTERNALTAENGMIIYNTTTNQFEFYENGAWVTK